MFIYIKDENKYVHIKYDSDVILDSLEKGIYTIEKINGYTLFAKNNTYDKGRVAEAGVFKQINNYVREYFSEEGKKVRELMYQPTRLGLFFKGEPGTGKTFLAAKLALELIEKEDGIGIYTSKLNWDLTEIVDAIRVKHPNRLVVFILDEFEKDYDDLNSNDKNRLLSFLDGGNSRDNVVTIATANSLRGIPNTLLNRPGRFEKVIEFKIKDDEVLSNLLEALIPDSLKGNLNIEQIKKELMKEDSLTIDKLKSIVRELLTTFLITGKASTKPTVDTISKEELQKSFTKNKIKKKKRKFNPLDPTTWSIREQESVDM